jgi:hypothetical protein
MKAKQEAVELVKEMSVDSLRSDLKKAGYSRKDIEIGMKVALGKAKQRALTCVNYGIGVAVECKNLELIEELREVRNQIKKL